MIPIIEQLYPDGRTKKGQIYGSECINCDHRRGVHFIDLKTHHDKCEGYGEKPCSCTRYR